MIIQQEKFVNSPHSLYSFQQMASKQLKHRQSATWFPILLIVLVSAFVYIQYGFNGSLQRDDAIYLYSGQQVARGLPPYVGIFDHKGPVTPLLAGLGVSLAHALRADDIFAVRLLFLGISILVIVSTYLLTRMLFNSHHTGLLTAFFFLNFWGFGRHAVSGPRAKTPMVMFELLSLRLTARKSWFWAGFTGALGFLTWQPAVIYPLTTLFLALVQAGNQTQRIKQFVNTLLGISLPLALITIYFVIQDAFVDFWGGMFLFNLSYLNRTGTSLVGNIKGFLAAIYEGYPTVSIPILIGFLAIIFIFFRRLQQHQNRFFVWLAEDHFAGLLLTFPVPFFWSLLDFQGYADFYIFLPYAAIGFGWFLQQALQAVAQQESVAPIMKHLLFIGVCLALVGGAAMYYAKTANNDLQTQQEWANQTANAYGINGKTIAINVPEAMVLLHRANPDPYVFVKNGIDEWIETAVPGGFTGWLSDLQTYNPSVIFYREAPGKHMPSLEAWLASEFQKKMVGNWTIYVKEPGA